MPKRGAMPADSRPMGVVVTPDGRQVWVSNGRGGTVSAIDVASDSVAHTIAVGLRPWGLALSPDGRWLYTANGPSNDVTVVDVTRLSVVRKIQVGKIPWGVAIGQPP